MNPEELRPGWVFSLRTAMLCALLLAFWLPGASSEDAGGGSGRNAGGLDAERRRIARLFSGSDFETRRDPESSRILPNSADLDRDGWPDFWEPIRGVGFPEYLYNDVKVTVDPAEGPLGAYRDDNNHALRMRFDGTKLGIRSVVPMAVDPGLAYEFSVWERDKNLQGTSIHIGVDWLAVDEMGERLLRRDELPNIAPGQEDWPEEPRSMRILDLPPGTNAAKFFVILDDRPDIPGGSYFGEIWLDDFLLVPLPKIRTSYSGKSGVAITYTGLFDNVPDPENPEILRGKRYRREISLRTIDGAKVPVSFPQSLDITPGSGRSFAEEVALPASRYGVFYFTIRLYDAFNRLLVEAVRSVSVAQPPGDGGGYRDFGISLGAPPVTLMRQPGLIRDLLKGSGVSAAKVQLWSDSGDAGDYLPLLSEELRRIRGAGVRLTGVINAPGGGGLAEVFRYDQAAFARRLAEAGGKVGMFMDDWQWGADTDGSLAFVTDKNDFAVAAKTLADFAGGLPQAWNRVLDGKAFSRPFKPEISSGDLPATTAIAEEVALFAQAFPWLFEKFRPPTGELYPPEWLVKLVPPIPADPVEAKRQEDEKTGSWVSVGPRAVNAHEADPSLERLQLEDLLKRTILAKIAAPDRIHFGEALDPAMGLVSIEKSPEGVLAVNPRPSLLGARTVAGMLDGASYIGQFRLLSPYVAHVFRVSTADDTVIALWHDGMEGEMPLDRSEIARGLNLSMVDWAGNKSALPDSVPVTRIPMFITGFPATMALTRMSVRIAGDPPLLSVNRRQPQMLEVTNHSATQLPVRFDLTYAANYTGQRANESGWTWRPRDLSANLPPAGSKSAVVRLPYQVSPDPNSAIQEVGPGLDNRDGRKLVMVKMVINTARPADMTLYREFSLVSDLDVDVVPLVRPDDPGFVTLQLRVRWLPPSDRRRRHDIRLTPYYMKRGELRENSSASIVVPALPPERRGDAKAPFESVEVRIPRQPARQTWVGLQEEGGGAYYLIDVTKYING